MAALGVAHVQDGRVVEGIALIEEAIADSEIHNRAQQSLFLSQLSAAYLAAARPEDALRAAREGLRGARARHERGEEAWNLRELAEAMLFTDMSEADAASRHYEEAMALADELGMRPLVAHCHLGLGKLYRRTDKREQAQEHLTTATTMYREMGMTYWLEKAEAEMGERR